MMMKEQGRGACDGPGGGGVKGKASVISQHNQESGLIGGDRRGFSRVGMGELEDREKRRAGGGEG